MSGFYHVYLSAPGVAPDDPVLQAKFDNALDWFRYTDESWLIYSIRDAKSWYERLGEFVREHGGHVFIVKLDITERQGWMPKSLWTWIKENQQRGKSTTG